MELSRSQQNLMCPLQKAQADCTDPDCGRGKQYIERNLFAVVDVDSAIAIELDRECNRNKKENIEER